MVTLTIDGLTLEVERGVYVYFGSADGKVDFYRQWDDIESQELKEQLVTFEKRAENVMDKLAEVAAMLVREKVPETVIN